jgi:hypothetical protein
VRLTASDRRKAMTLDGLVLKQRLLWRLLPR